MNPIKDVAIPLVAALLGLWVATLKFKGEQIWNDKYLAYKGAIQSMETIMHWANESGAEVNMLPTLGTPNIAEEYGSAQREVVRQSKVGALILSKDFISALDEFTSELFGLKFQLSENFEDDPYERDRAWAEHASRVQSLASTYLPKLIAMARDDLGV
ncbi:hypothetical protein [Luteimonas sp. A611]